MAWSFRVYKFCRLNLATYQKQLKKSYISRRREQLWSGCADCHPSQRNSFSDLKKTNKNEKRSWWLPVWYKWYVSAPMQIINFINLPISLIYKLFQVEFTIYYFVVEWISEETWDKGRIWRCVFFVGLKYGRQYGSNADGISNPAKHKVFRHSEWRSR